MGLPDMLGGLDLGSEEGEDQMMKMMEGMVNQLLSKEVLHPSLSDLTKQVRPCRGWHCVCVRACGSNGSSAVFCGINFYCTCIRSPISPSWCVRIVLHTRVQY